jgi:hypothetical protein
MELLMLLSQVNMLLY